MIPEVFELAEKASVTTVFLSFAVSVLIAARVFAVQSIAAWFDDRNP